MEKCSEDTSAVYIQRGSYGLVSRIEGQVNCAQIELLDAQRVIQRSFFKNLLNRRTPSIDPLVATSSFAHFSLFHHQIGDPDIQRMRVVGSPESKDGTSRLADYWNFVIDLYGAKESFDIRETGERPPHSLGRSLSDILEVLPIDLSSRMLLAAADPDITQLFLNTPKKNSGLQRPDNQTYAVEATVLLPNMARHELFAEMAKLSPDQVGKQGGARAFLGLISSNWLNTRSPHSGVQAIYRNLEGEVASTKVLEVQADLLELGKIVRGEV